MNWNVVGSGSLEDLVERLITMVLKWYQVSVNKSAGVRVVAVFQLQAVRPNACCNHETVKVTGSCGVGQQLVAVILCIPRRPITAVFLSSNCCPTSCEPPAVFIKG
jgi:hypothetical protein